MGKWTEEAKQRVREGNLTKPMRRNNRGIPKSKEHRQAMSLAKVGREFPEEHRASMSATGQYRWDMFFDLYEKHPELSKKEVWDLVGVYVLARKYAYYCPK
jgi:hypothetical protein